MKMKKLLAGVLTGVMLLSAVNPVFASEVQGSYERVIKDGIAYYYNQGGETIAVNVDNLLDGSINVIEKDGYAFKDFDGDGEVNVYEDWRNEAGVRAEYLANLMAETQEGREAIAGLMLYSGHQRVTTTDISGLNSFIQVNNGRNILVQSYSDADTLIGWGNNVQAWLEANDPYGIPANNSSDPRHSSGNTDAEYEPAHDGSLSSWPTSMGLTATFNADTVLEFGQIASTEYRALGLHTALSPQIDLATEPRWSRGSGTFGEDPTLAADLARAYVDGFQTTYDDDGNPVGWGSGSVNAMAKHWPSGGAEEAGRDGHYGYGAYAVYPGDNFADHLKPFTEGAFDLEGGTGMASAIMPYYTVTWDQDTVYGENVANSYSRYIINDLLRGEYSYDGVVCTDWSITGTYSNSTPTEGGGAPRAWGAEHLSVDERHAKILVAGVDQFGGNNEIAPIMAAYDIMTGETVSEHVDPIGVTAANKKFAESGRRLLTNTFNAGLFENPYLDMAESRDNIGTVEFKDIAYDAQVESVVMVKNSGNIINDESLRGKKVYYVNASNGSTNAPTIYNNYFDAVDNPEDADFSIVLMSPATTGSGYSNGQYVPIKMQYGTYRADLAREEAIAYSDYFNTDGTDRSYKGKTSAAAMTQVDNLKATKEAMGDKPVVVYFRMSSTYVLSEFEEYADAMVIGYGIMTQAALEVISGETEPSGLLPMQIPASMDTVETQYEDTAHDMACHLDTEGNLYDFGFGLNWSGRIQDERTAKYVDTLNVDNGSLNAEAKAYYKILEALYKIYEKITDDDLAEVLPAVVEEFKLARLDAAHIITKVNGNNPQDLSANEINQAIDRLKAAYELLSHTVGDKAALEILLEKAQEVMDAKDQYIPSTIAGLQDAIDAAMAVYEDGNAMDVDIQEVFDNLLVEWAKAQKQPNKDNLINLLAQAEEIVPEEFTPESYSVLMFAMAYAQDVITDAEADEEAVLAAEDALFRALSDLVRADTDDSDDTDEDTNEDTNEDTKAGEDTDDKKDDTDDTNQTEAKGDTEGKGDTDGKDNTNNTSGKGTSGKTNAVKTGDTTKVAILIIVFAAAAGLGIVSIRRKKVK